MPQAHSFTACATCRKPMPVSNPRDSCLRCLGDGHQTEQCRICKASKPRTRKERDFRLKQLLMEAALQPSGPERPMLRLPRCVVPQSRRETQNRLSTVNCRPQSIRLGPGTARPPRCSPWHSQRASRSPHRRPEPPKASSADKSRKAAVPVLTPAVPAAQAPPSPDLSELSADDGLEGITDQPSTPGTFETAKDLIKLSAASPLPYGENPLAPMPRVPSRAVQKEVSAPAEDRREEVPERARRSPAPPRDRHQEELRRPSPEDSRRWSQSRERRSGAQSLSRGYQYRSRSARSRSFSGAPRGPVQGKLLSAALPVPAPMPDGAGGYSIQAFSIPPA
ncbi:hypothetical protein UY3_01147 [Chelonia mydas]|uniref:Uncharacterized protein n=1 Tax=Chelonia mydas TaxID=8469 RepID=M7CKL4_CHEMY|nr:hypothetical protein UY3_01147 [Chelonia mydas]